jgi:hypothetical protein
LTSNWGLYFGSDGVDCGSARSTQDFFAWQADFQTGSTLGPPIKAVSGNTTRVLEVASFAVTIPAGTRRSLSATIVPWTAFTADNTAMQLYFDANNDDKLYETSTGATSTVTSDFRIGGSSSTTATVATMSGNASSVLRAYYDAVNRASCLNGTCVTAAASLTLPTGAATVYVGGRSAGASPLNAVVKNVCVDSTSDGC